MQATVRHFDPQTGAGDVLLDNGQVREFGADAFARSGLRLLRLGQRVRLDLDGDGTVHRLTILTLRFPDA